MKVKFCALFFYCHREATCVSKSNHCGGFSKRLWLFEATLAAPQSKRQLTNKDINKEAPQSFDWRASFLVVTPTGFDLVTEGHDAERARDSIMPRSAAT